MQPASVNGTPCLERAHQQFWTKPLLSDRAEDALLVLAAEERIIGSKDSHQHILRFRAAL